ncbi:hypothetical protein [Halovivax sp.]|uniref:hypothetical protein n=1 Tax=Halovivax sp. TaxID=1935978 RepID=UPI0025BB882C|nr:hypothetical protein [Halovivax sp.]
MSDFVAEDLGTALLTKLQGMFTAQPDDIPGGPPEDRFLVWCIPGLPFEPEGFEFAHRGMWEDDEDDEGDYSEQAQLHAAERWARVANFVPDPASIPYHGDRFGTMGMLTREGQNEVLSTTFEPDGQTVASIYRSFLDHSQVPDTEPTEEQQEAIEEYREIVTGETIETYENYMVDYELALEEYLDKWLDAQVSDDPRVVRRWSRMEDVYRRRLNMAHDRWVSEGRKHEVEDAMARISQLEGGNVTQLKQELIEDFRQFEETNTQSGVSFYRTSVTPPRFAESDAWNRVEFTREMVEEYSEEGFEREQIQADADVSIGPIVALAGEYDEEEEIERTYEEIDTEDFELSFEYTQVKITRPWFSPELLFSNAWRWDPNMPELDYLTTDLSDGASPPDGAMIGYATNGLFLRNVELRMAELRKEDSELREDFERVGEGGVGLDVDISLGPIPLSGGGSYEEETSEEESKGFELDADGTLSVDGMQLIGFRCRMLPKVPNPSDEVGEWIG